MQPFNPKPASTVNIDVSASSQSVALPFAAGSTQVWVVNDGTATAWVNFGNSSITASTSNGLPIRSGVDILITIPNGTTHVAAIAAGATGKIYFTAGTGH